MSVALDLLARSCGVEPTYPGWDGAPVRVPDETLGMILTALGVDPDSTRPLETPRHHDDGQPAPRCHLPEWLLERRAWGIAVQLYELRSGRNWGIGDLADLASFCEIAAGAGADFVGLNPLHALFLADPQRCSPFSPSNRRFLNPLYIAVDRVEGFRTDMVEQADVEKLRATPLVDYSGVARLKLAALRAIWHRGETGDADGLRAFVEAGGRALQRHAVFEALSAHRRRAKGGTAGWKDWPPGLRQAGSDDVAAFARDHADEVAFHCWLQWLADRQLRAAAERARASGMRIGLYLDLAVGEAPDGSATWSDPDIVTNGVHIGAPPDMFSACGQDWGLAPLSPLRLAEAQFRPYRDLVRAAMRHGGALRIDHAMALRQLFWIPQGRPATEGGFVRYPTPELLRVLAAEAQRSRTVVIGEDLGHVPEGFRDEMADAGILSYRILYFERDGGRIRAPGKWPALALACLSTHDLPTLEGWWSGSDIRLRLEHGLIDADAAAAQRRERASERKSLLRALASCGALPRAARAAASRGMRLDPAVAVAAHRFIARTPCRLACVRLADAVGETQPTNLPGVAETYPNWQRKLAVPLENLPALPLFRAVARTMAQERPR